MGYEIKSTEEMEKIGQKIQIIKNEQVKKELIEKQQNYYQVNSTMKMCYQILCKGKVSNKHNLKTK